MSKVGKELLFSLPERTFVLFTKLKKAFLQNLKSKVLNWKSCSETVKPQFSFNLMKGIWQSYMCGNLFPCFGKYFWLGSVHKGKPLLKRIIFVSNIFLYSGLPRVLSDTLIQTIVFRASKYKALNIGRAKQEYSS